MNKFTNKTVDLICIVLLLPLFSCNNHSYLEQALRQAGENRNELEKVLEHYKDDTLKYRAAQFLIENMPGHYSYDESEELNNYYNNIDSIYEQYKDLSKDSLILVYEAISAKYDLSRLKIIPDIKHISADYLIYNIDHSLDVWLNGEWAKHLTFDEFCEYILPYKCDQLQTLDNWKEYAKGFCKANIDSLHFYSLYKSLSYKACEIVNLELKKQVNLRIEARNKTFPIKRLSFAIKKNIGTCEDQVFIAACVMRAKGIPVAMDYTPQWPFKNMGHSWNTLLDNAGRRLIFLGCDSKIGIPHKEDQRKAKVFRKTYTINRELEQLIRKEKYVPPLFRDVCIKDVSEDYAKTYTVNLPLKKNIKNKYGYLAVFNNKNWIPIYWGKIHKKSISFTKMGNNVVYLPVLYNKKGISPFGNPFLLDVHGNTKEIVADTTIKQTMTLYRKYYISSRMFYLYRRLSGVKIQASNYEDFRDSLTAYTLSAPGSQSGEIVLNDTIGKYRYWRYLSPENAYCTIAELYFFEKGKNAPVYGEIIGTPGSYQNEGTIKENVFDRNILTAFTAPAPSGAWVGMDFKEPVRIERISYVPRGDGNFIAIGNEYELMYWYDGKWKSLGRKVADNIKLIYENCPVGALFLLRNHTEGSEERIFTYENNSQVWW